MTELVLKSGRWALDLAGIRWPVNGWRLVIFAALLLLIAAGPDLRALTFSAIADAYLQVTVFVAGTLALVYTFETIFGVDLGRVMSRARIWQVPMASFLGALPGCGGAIIVITQYTRGYVSFGGVVAVLIATMGDAAFLLIAREPFTGMMMMLVGFSVGTLAGWAVDAIHGSDFMSAEVTKATELAAKDAEARAAQPKSPDNTAMNTLWIWLVAPAGVLGLLLAMQYDTDALFGAWAAYEPTKWIGITGGLLCLVMWAFAERQHAQLADHDRLSTKARIIKDTNFVTSWVVLGFLTYELATHFAGAGIETWLHVWAPFVPLVAILIGFIPGCGPQIVVTTLYLTGAVPLSAQMGNAIANDGDALFPAIALAPRAAFVATIYSALPALILAYAYYFLVEAY